MNASYMYLNDIIHKTVQAPGDQGRIVAMAVAMSAAAYAPLPSSAVEDISEFYEQQVRAQVVQRISALNEGVVFAANLALEFTMQFWKQRYYAAHPQCLVESNLSLSLDSLLNKDRVETFDFNTIMSGGLFVLSLDTVRFLNKYKVEIAKLVCAIHWTGEAEGT